MIPDKVTPQHHRRSQGFGLGSTRPDEVPSGPSDQAQLLQIGGLEQGSAGVLFLLILQISRFIQDHPLLGLPMKALPTEPTRVEIDGRHLRCLYCSREQFHRRRLRVETASPAGMPPEWHEAVANLFHCAHCGFIHGFLGH